MKQLKRAFSAFMMCALMFVLFSFPVEASRHPDRVVDDAGLLSEKEFSKLTDKLDEISEKYEIDVCVITVNSFSQANATIAVDDYYDHNGYGMGDDDSGIMLYISMAERDWAMSTAGDAIDYFSDSDLSDIEEEVVPYLSEGEYYEAFVTFAELCDKEIDYETTFHGFIYLIISLIIGAIAGLIYVVTLRSQLKSVAPVDSAVNYVINGSMNVTNARELYLYKTLHVTKKESSSSGSSTHRSSSGVSHGGSRGKF